jgi:hypothetical protein
MIRRQAGRPTHAHIELATFRASSIDRQTPLLTVLVSKKLVPDQNPSMAVPFRTRVIFGIATESDVASSAAISVMTIRDPNAV